MLRQRIIPILIFLPIIVAVIVLGGWLYAVGVALVLSLAAYEFWQIYGREGLRPSRPLLLIGVVALALGRQVFGFTHSPLILTLLLLAAMVWHLVDYERGAFRSGTDFALTVAGLVYLGWLGAYLVTLRALPQGKWWVLLALFSVWLADVGAYLVGSAIGRRQLVPRLSPQKTWEGYLAGIVTGTLGGWGVAALWGGLTGPQISVRPVFGLALGFGLSMLAPLGDLGISMIKRELNIKDTGRLFPGHGGAFDRIDTWVWAGALAYYAVLWIPH